MVTTGDAVPQLHPDDEPTERGRCTIVGVHSTTRRPWSRLSPSLVEFAEGFCAEPVDVVATEQMRARMMAAVDKMERQVSAWMEMACLHVILLGYQPEECVIEHHDRPRRIRHVLRVRRMECFDVAVTRHWDGTQTVATITPRILGWPPRR